MDYVNTYLLLTKNVPSVRRHVRSKKELRLEPQKTRDWLTCKSGLVLSVQAGEYLYCTPRTNIGPYSEVEVMVQAGEIPPTLLHEWTKYGSMDDVFGYIPVSLVDTTIEMCGGIGNGNDKEGLCSGS